MHLDVADDNPLQAPPTTAELPPSAHVGPPPDASASFADGALPESIRVPGFCHICHYALADVCKVLKTWPALNDQLKLCCKVFSHTGRRERFKALCIDRSATHVKLQVREELPRVH